MFYYTSRYLDLRLLMSSLGKTRLKFEYEAFKEIFMNYVLNIKLLHSFRRFLHNTHRTELIFFRGIKFFTFNIHINSNIYNLYLTI